MTRAAIRSSRFPSIEMLVPRTSRFVLLSWTAIFVTAAPTRPQFTTCATRLAGQTVDAFDLQAADIDGDGDMDLVETQQGTRFVRIYQNQGDGTFPNLIVLGQSLGAQQFYSVRVADLDADGIPDLIACDTHNHDVVAWRGTGSGLFANATVYHAPGGSSGGAFYYLDVGDVDGDGYLDFVTADATNRVVVGMNGGASGPGTFTFRSYQFPGQTLSNDWFAPYGIVLGDWDVDGDLDIAIDGFRTLTPGRQTPPQPLMRTMLNDGSGTFAAPVGHALTNTVFKGMQIAAADFDADGDEDVCFVDALFAGAGSPVRLMINQGGVGWTEQQVALLRNELHRVTTGDVDGDGDIDILVASYRINSNFDEGLFVILNPLVGGGTWTSSRYFTSEVGGLALADFDGDGRPDLAYRTHSWIRIDLNCGTAPFSAAFGIASFGSRGFSEMQTAGLPAVGGLLSLRAPNLRPNALGAVLLGVHLVPPLDLSTVFLPSLPPAGTPLLFVDPIFVFGSSVDPFGVLSHQIAIPASPSLQGITVSTQGIVFDPTAGLTGLTTTRPVRHFLW